MKYVYVFLKKKKFKKKMLQGQLEMLLYQM